MSFDSQEKQNQPSRMRHATSLVLRSDNHTFCCGGRVVLGQLVTSVDIYRKADDSSFQMVHINSQGGDIERVHHCLKLSIAGDRYPIALGECIGLNKVFAGNERLVKKSRIILKKVWVLL